MNHRRDTRKKANQQFSVAKDVPKVQVWRFRGVECYFWFDDNGDLCAKAPAKARRHIEAFVQRYRSLLNNDEVVEFIEKLEPVGHEHLSIKKFAVLDLVVEAEMRGETPVEEIALTPEKIESRLKLHQGLLEID
jgi:hypothetical protein